MSPVIQSHTLSNGLQVLLHPDPTVPVVAVDVMYHVGSKDEQHGLTGMAHLLEHMTFENGPDIRRGDYDKYCTEVGGENNAFTSSDVTNYYITLPAGQLPLGLWLEAERMAGFTVGQDTFTTQRDVIIEEKHQTVDDVPYAAAWPVMREISYGPEHPYNWEPIGFTDDLLGMTNDDVRDFYRRFYTPANATLVIAGNFDPAHALSMAGEYFGPIQSAPAPQRRTANPLLHRSGTRREVPESTTPFCAAFLGYHVPDLRHPDMCALDLLANVIADGESSRLYRALEYTQEIASETDCFIDDGELGSMFYVYAIAQDENIRPDQLRDGILTELRRVITHGVTDREVQKAKNMKMAELVRGMDSVGSRAERMAYCQIMFNDPARTFTEIEHYRTITAADLQNAAGRYLATAEPNLVEYYPEG